MKIKKNRAQHKARSIEALLALRLAAKNGAPMRHRNDRRAKDARRDETRQPEG